MTQNDEARAREKAKEACLLAGVDHWTDDDGNPVPCSSCERITQAVLSFAQERDALAESIREDVAAIGDERIGALEAELAKARAENESLRSQIETACLDRQMAEQAHDAVAKELKELRQAAESFLLIVKTSEEAINNCITISTIHGTPYIGSSYVAEKLALEQALTGGKD